MLTDDSILRSSPNRSGRLRIWATVATLAMAAAVVGCAIKPASPAAEPLGGPDGTWPDEGWWTTVPYDEYASDGGWWDNAPWRMSGVPSDAELLRALNELFERQEVALENLDDDEVLRVSVPGSQCESALRQWIRSAKDAGETINIHQRQAPFELGRVVQVVGDGAERDDGLIPDWTDPDSLLGDGTAPDRFIVQYLTTDWGGEQGERVFDGFLNEPPDYLVVVVQRWPGDSDLPWRFVSC